MGASLLALAKFIYFTKNRAYYKNNHQCNNYL